MKPIKKDTDGIDIEFNFRSGKQSVAGIAKANLFEFPVFVSTSVTLDYATATNSLLEQVYASYLQSAISINPVVDAETVKNGDQFKAFKSNTNKYLEHTEMDYAHDACHNIIQEDGVVTEFSMLTLPDADIKFINECYDHEALSEFEHYFQEAMIDTDSDEFKKILDDKKKETEKYMKDDVNYAKNLSSNELNDKRKELTQKEIDTFDDKTNRDKEKHAWEKERNKRDKENHEWDIKTNAPKMLDEGKIQKLNTLKPLMMNVNLKVISKDGGVSQPVEYVVGVKTFCRLIDANILPEVAQYPIKEMNKFSRFVKWRSGEIKFGEFLFKIKSKKQTAIDSRDPKRKWYRRLYELAHSTNDSISTFLKSDSKKSVKNNGSVIPNATIIISNSDVINIKNETKIDLLKASNARSFCKELFLMSFVIVDTDNDAIKIMTPDLHNDFEIHSMASVTKQLSMLDTTGVTTKEIAKMFGK